MQNFIDRVDQTYTNRIKNTGISRKSEIPTTNIWNKILRQFKFDVVRDRRMWRSSYAKFDSSPITIKTRVTEITHRTFVYCHEASSTIFLSLCTNLLAIPREKMRRIVLTTVADSYSASRLDQLFGRSFLDNIHSFYNKNTLFKNIEAETARKIRAIWGWKFF